ncbi:MAG: hypothetical protein AB7V48_00105 [Sedimentibacter sp.]
MDWNKASTILIVAFIVLNIFLFSSSFNDIFSEEYDVYSDQDFIDNIGNLLKKKNLSIKSELPKETYILPTLDTEYEIIQISNELLERFLGSGVEPIEDVYTYSNGKGEVLEFTEGKKLHYIVRERISGETLSNESLTEHINKFIEDKKINSTGYSENYRHISNKDIFVVYTKKYNNYSMDNSYMKFYFDKDGIYKFEMQNIAAVKETADKIRTFSAAEALPRLLSYKDLENKEIIHMEMTFYSEEDENWQYISRINSDPVWKVIFNDGTQKHLSSINTYNID